ncbi:MAG TPA: hypothetical protein VFV38_19445 [Ktedonobacteraceae bacterium]|nr:hypothetical protein [Ktedonobacteraceae bacterium]
MYPSHLLSNDRVSHYAELLREAEHERLVRLAHPATSRHLNLSHWFARSRQRISVFWPQTAHQRRAATLAPALPAACCVPCSC